MESVIGIVLLVLAIWAIVKVIQSGADTGKKVLWVLLILFLPILGVVLWWFMGPK